MDSRRNTRRAQVLVPVIVAAIAVGLSLSSILAPRQEPAGAAVALSRQDDYATRHTLQGRPTTALGLQDDYWTRNNPLRPLGLNDDYATRHGDASAGLTEQDDYALRHRNE